jgi:hypothetical protein
MANTLKELSDLYAKKQPMQVDALTEEAPILGMMPFEAASHGLWNAYEDIIEVTGASFVDIDAALPTVGTESNVKKFDLSIMGGQMTCAEDKARMFGGADKYFASKMPAVLRASGSSAERAILYDTFRAFAIANGYVLEPASASGDSNYTILAVRFVSGETTGLYSPDGFEQGAMLNTELINGGNLYAITSGGVLGYGVRLKGYFGVQVANPKSVGAIVNVKSTKIPTAMQIDDLIAMVRGNPANTYLFMHPRALALIQSLKETYMQVGMTDNGINRQVLTWNGIRIVTSYNFYNGTEVDVAI